MKQAANLPKIGRRRSVLSTRGAPVEERAGRTTVVTGGASVIGRAFARRCASARPNVVVADVDDAGLEEVARELRHEGADAIAVHTDGAQQEDLHVLAAGARRLIEQKNPGADLEETALRAMPPPNLDVTLLSNRPTTEGTR